MVGTRRVGIGLFFVSLTALAAGCSGGGGASKDNEPAATDDTATTNENTAVDVDVLANDTDKDSKDVLTIENVGTPAHGTAVIDNGKVLYTPAPNYSGSDTFSYTISDGRSFTPPPGANVTVTITHVNQTPVAVAHSATTAEDTATDVDVAATDTDVDGDALTISAVTTPAHGAATIVSNRIHYVPVANFDGADTVGYTISDGNGGTADGTVSITVTPVDDAPVAVADAFSDVEDTTLAIPAPGVLGNDTDVDGPALSAVLVAQATKGTVTLNADGSFTYVPNADANGTDSFTYKSNDGTLDSATVTVTLTVAPQNDPPIAVADAYTTAEDTPLTVNAANGVLANDVDVDSATITAVLVSNPSKGTLALAADGSFTYTPNANANGADSFQYQANDGSLSSVVTTVALTLTPVNDPPVAADDAYSTNEDTPLVVADPGVQANDSDIDGPVAVPTAFPVATPTKGTLSLSAAGGFTYTPNADANGTDSFTYGISDGLATSGTATVTLTINAVNDAPSFTAGPSQTAQEDAATQTVTSWAAGISAGPADESSQSVSFLVTNDNPALFTTQPAVSANGTLTYTPAPDANGLVNVTVKAHDNGGTANGGVDTSVGQGFQILLTPVNDAPSFTSGGDVTVAEDSGAYVNAWATNVSAGPANESAQHLTFVVTGDTNASLFSLPPAVTPGGVLSFETAANANGVATITLHLQDDGGTANGGVDSTSSQTFTITVTPVDDAPVAKDDTLTTTENQPANVSFATLLLNDSDLDGPSLSVDPTTIGVATSPAHGVLVVSGNSITYAPFLNYHGADSFTYRATDGTLQSPAATVNVEVDAHDLAPSFTKGADVSVIQDSGAYGPAAWASSISDGTGESGQSLTFDLLASNPSLFASGPTIDATGHLAFTPAAGASGSSTVTVSLTDDNGSPSDATDDATSAPQVFTITVTPVPSFSLQGDVSVAQGSGTTTLPGFASNIRTAGTPSFEVYFDDGGLFDFNCSPTCGNPQIDASGTLSFRVQPAVQGQSGTANVTVVMTDSANGRQASQVFHLTVTFVNQPPTFNLASSSIVLQDDDNAPHSYPGFATGLFPGAFDEFAQSLSFSLSFDPTELNSAPTIDASGTLSLDLKGAGLPGTITVDVTLSDDGRRPDGTTGPIASTSQSFTVTFHDHTLRTHFVSSTPSDGSFVNAQTSGFGGPGELTPAKLFFDSPDLDCAGMRGSSDITVSNLTEPGVGAFMIECPEDAVGVPSGQVWIAFNGFDSRQNGDQFQFSLTNIRGTTSGVSDVPTASVIFTYDDQAPQASYIASQQNPFSFSPGGCAPANSRAIFQFDEAMNPESAGAFTFDLLDDPNPPAPVAPDPAGMGFATLDAAGDTWYFVPNDLLGPGNYSIELSALTDLAGNAVVNAKNFQALSVCNGNGGGPGGLQPPTLTQITFRNAAGGIEATIPASQIANDAFLVPPEVKGRSDDLVVTFDQPISLGGNNQLQSDDNGGLNGVSVQTSGASLVFEVSQRFPAYQFQTNTRYDLSLDVCAAGTGGCEGSDLRFYVQTMGVATPPTAVAFASGESRASDGSVPAVRPEEPWQIGFSGLVDPRTLVPSSFQLSSGGSQFPVILEPSKSHLGANAVTMRASDGAGGGVALPTGTYTLTVSGLLDVNSPPNPVPPATFTFDVLTVPAAPNVNSMTPLAGDVAFATYSGRRTASIFMGFGNGHGSEAQNLMAPEGFRDTGDPATRGFSLTEAFTGALGSRAIPLKGLTPGSLGGCCGGSIGVDPLEPPRSTFQLVFPQNGPTPDVGFESNHEYVFTPLDGLTNIDGTPIANAGFGSGSPFQFRTASSEGDPAAFPTVEQYSFGGQILPDGTFTCAPGVCGGSGTPSTGLTAQLEFQSPSGSAEFDVFTELATVADPGVNPNDDDFVMSHTFSAADIQSDFNVGDNNMFLAAFDGGGNATGAFFLVHVPQLPAAPTFVVSSSGLVTVQGTVSAEDGPFVSQIEATIALTDDGSGTPSLEGFGPGLLTNVVRHADGSLDWSAVFDPSRLPPKTKPSAAYHAIVTEELPDGLPDRFDTNNGGGDDSNPGSIDAFSFSAAIPVQGPPPPPPMLSGTVVDVAGNNSPIEGATIDVPGDPPIGSTVSDVNGAWALPIPTPGPTWYVHSSGPSGYFEGYQPVTVPFAGLSGLGPQTVSDAELQSFLPSAVLTSGDVLVTTNSSLLQQSWIDIGAPSTPVGNVNGGGGNPMYLFENATPGDWTLTLTPTGATCVWTTPGGPADPGTPLRIGSHGFTVIEVDCN